VTLKVATLLLALLAAGCAESNFELGDERLPKWVASPETVQKVEVYFWVTGNQTIVVTHRNGDVVRQSAEFSWHPYTVAQGYERYPVYQVAEVNGIREIYMHPCRDNKLYIVDAVPDAGSDIHCDSPN